MNAPRQWTPEEETTLFEGRTKLPLKPYSLLAAEMGRHPDAVQDKWRRTDWVKKGFSRQIADEERFVVKSKFNDKIISTLDKRTHLLQVRADTLGDVLERAVERLPALSRKTYKTSKKRNTGTSEDVGLLLSDLHIGHQHTLEETGGISEYSMDIFFKRLENLKNTIVDIVELHQNMYHLPKLHIFCAGDIVAGMNATGAWSPLYIKEPVVDQFLHGAKALTEMIYFLHGMFEEVNFYGVVGNHGRTAYQGVQKDHDNWDYVVYKFIENSFMNVPSVKFNIPKAWFVRETIRNHKFLMVHGDWANKGGIPLSKLLNFELRMSPMIQEFSDYLLAGHYHNAAELTTTSGKILLNGSFVGSDIYSLRECHAGSKPEQKLFGINDRHGITWTYNINLDIEREKGEAK